MSNHITILVMLIFVAEVWQAMKLELAAIGGNVEARYNVGMDRGAGRKYCAH